LVVVADAGMLSAANLKALDEAGLRFIVGSRTTKAPIDLASHFRWHGDAFTDGQVIDTITPRVATAAARSVNDVAKRAEPVWDPSVHPPARCGTSAATGSPRRPARSVHDSCALRCTRSGCGIIAVNRPSGVVTAVSPSGRAVGVGRVPPQRPPVPSTNARDAPHGHPPR
jgi:hypothetical protein